MGGREGNVAVGGSSEAYSDPYWIMAATERTGAGRAVVRCRYRRPVRVDRRRVPSLQVRRRRWSCRPTRTGTRSGSRSRQNSCASRRRRRETRAQQAGLWPAATPRSSVRRHRRVRHAGHWRPAGSRAADGVDVSLSRIWANATPAPLSAAGAGACGPRHPLKDRTSRAKSKVNSKLPRSRSLPDNTLTP